MSINKEVKVGIMGLLAILVFYFGFNFLKGLDIFSTVNKYVVTYENVEGLEVSNSVSYNGVNVGRVLKLTPDFEKNVIRVELAINRKVKVTENTVALLADDGLIGGKLIKLNILPGKFLRSGDNLSGEIEKSLMVSVQEKLNPTIKNADSLMVSLTKIVNEFHNTGAALKVLMSSATETSNGVNGLLIGNSKNIGLAVNNAALLTANLNALTKSLDSQIKPILGKTNTLADSLNKLQLGKTVVELNHTINSLETLVKNINKGQGTLGKLTNDDSLYINLDRTAASINLLLSDMKENPKRYVHFSLFSRKEKK